MTLTSAAPYVATLTQPERIETVRNAVTAAGSRGITPLEFVRVVCPGEVTAVSKWAGVFTLLRQDGLISAIEERRSNYHVYVDNDQVLGRTKWFGYRHGGDRDAVREVCDIIIMQMEDEIAWLKKCLTMGRLSPKSRIEHLAKVEATETALALVKKQR